MTHFSIVSAATNGLSTFDPPKVAPRRVFDRKRPPGVVALPDKGRGEEVDLVRGLDLLPIHASQLRKAHRVLFAPERPRPRPAGFYPAAPELTAAQRSVSLATGLPLVWGHEFDPGHAAAAEIGDDASGRTALYAAYLAAIPATYWETTWGGSGVEEYKRGLYRLIVYCNMLEGNNEPIAPHALIESVSAHGAGNMASHHKAPLQGLWRPEVAIWDKVREGDLLGTLRDLYGDTRIEIRASRDGTLIGMPRMQYVVCLLYTSDAADE